MSQMTVREYDDEFVNASTNYFSQVEELRIIRHALDQKHSQLSIKRSEMLMQRCDLDQITQQMLEIQQERRMVNDQIDLLLQSHLAYIKSGTHQHRLTA